MIWDLQLDIKMIILMQEDFFQDDFKSGFLTSNNEVLVSLITEAVSKSKESKINELDRK